MNPNLMPQWTHKPVAAKSMRRIMPHARAYGRNYQLEAISKTYDSTERITASKQKKLGHTNFVEPMNYHSHSLSNVHSVPSLVS